MLVVAVVAVAIGAVAAAVELLPTGEKIDRTPTPTGADTVAGATTQVRAPKNFRPPPAERTRILSTIALFISTAVTRHHPERSFGITDASLRQGLTRREWAKGTIPVVPFPAAAVDLVNFQSFTGDTAMVEVLLEPIKGSHLLRKTFQMDLRRAPPHRWLVSYWVPEGVSQSQIDLNRPQSPDVIAEAANPPHLSAKWIYVPLGLLIIGVLVIPAALFGSHALAARRAEKRYRESLPPDELPRSDLPH